MTNWPNIQEYRNFETKFIDDPKRNVLIYSDANSDLETVIKDEYTTENNADDLLNGEKLQNPESKIVRCVIRKDFEETFKKVEREEGVPPNQECVRLKPVPEQTVVDRTLNKVRLQNHLKWMKQKEEEYLQKKEAEKIARQKKKEEEIRLEKARKQKEKERVEKLRVWQEQKTREKEEKKKEKMVIKMLEEEFKAPQTVDKEKLIEEWVKLKNKQKQIEVEKKAEQLKKEEESKALRQTLAELSYRQWKERVKGRMMVLPKNGYQIFGPKPVPVVKEDWNHDFTRCSPRNPNYCLRNVKSSSTTTLSLCPAVKDLDDFQKDVFCTGDLKARSPSFYQLKKKKSGLNLWENSETSLGGKYEMPLKELQPGTVDQKKKETKKFKNDFDKIKDFIPRDVNAKSEINFFSKCNATGDHAESHLKDFMCFTGAQGDQNPFASSQKKSSDLVNSFPDAQLLPSKKKIDLYINTCMQDVEENPLFEIKNKTAKKKATSNDGKIPKDGKTEKSATKTQNETAKSPSRETFPRPQTNNRARSLSLQKFGKNQSEISRPPVRKPADPASLNGEPCRRCQSCEKSVKKIAKTEQKMKGCSASKSTAKVTETIDETRKSLTKSKTNCSQKRKGRKAATASEVIASKSEKKLSEIDSKSRKKSKRRNSLSKSFSFIDSPYCAKSSSKTTNKIKATRRKNAKDVETKSDEGGHCRKLSATKL